MRTLDKILGEKLRVLLVGPPGCGKTARLRAAAKSAGRRLVIMRASLSERVDFGGCLIPDAANGVTRSLPLELLHELKSTATPTLLLLDDLGQAPIDVQAAIMRLFDGDELSPAVLIAGATNRPGDKAGVSALCEPLRSRFDLSMAIPTPDVSDKADGPVLLNNWADEVSGWCEWQIGAYPECVEVCAWHRSFQLGASYSVGPVLYGWKPSADPALRFPDFRTWETVCKLWTAGIRDLTSISASIGKRQAAAFLAFASMAGKLPDPEQVWIDPHNSPVPSEPSALCLTATRLASAVTAKHAGNFVHYIDRLPAVFGALAVRDAYRRLGPALAGNPVWQKWFLTHEELFTA